jgi:hypothetical protein
MSKAVVKAASVIINLDAGALYLGFNTGRPLSYESRSTFTVYKKILRLPIHVRSSWRPNDNKILAACC